VSPLRSVNQIWEKAMRTIIATLLLAFAVFGMSSHHVYAGSDRAEAMEEMMEMKKEMAEKKAKMMKKAAKEKAKMQRKAMKAKLDALD
jgi:hypothetical protein